MKCKYDYCDNEVDTTIRKSKNFCCLKCKNKYNVDKKRWDLKLKAIAYKGGKCNCCGYNKYPTALEFHHLDRENKDFTISKIAHTRSWIRIENEIDKCELLCANCHREHEFEKYSKHKKFISELAKKHRFVSLVNHNPL